VTEGPLEALARAPHLAIVTDVDGTLTPIRPTPEEVTIDPAVESVLVALARSGARVVVASGRPRDFLARWFPHPAIALSAEHGSWIRDGSRWSPTVRTDPAELAALASSLEALAREEPGLRVEPKSMCCAVHTRALSSPRRAAALARLDAAVDGFLAAHPGWARLRGHEIVEVRPAGASKAHAVGWVRAHGAAPILALGDDVTDEDIFEALSADGSAAGDLAVLVSTDPERRTAAAYRVATPADVERLLAWILAARTGGEAGPGPELAPTRRP
jgi:trehalose-phosphatase